MLAMLQLDDFTLGVIDYLVQFVDSIICLPHGHDIFCLKGVVIFKGTKLPFDHFSHSRYRTGISLQLRLIWVFSNANNKQIFLNEPLLQATSSPTQRI